MKCPKCHFNNPNDTLYCGKCGIKLHSPEEISISPTMTLETPVNELSTGAAFAGRYQIIEELGAGGMGRVFKAFDTEVGEKVAIKLIKPEVAADSKVIDRFRNELKLARKISHKNVCRMYDLNKNNDAYYITMEYVSGEDLESFIKAGDFEKAEEEFRKYISLNPDVPNPYDSMGELYFIVGKLGDAVASFETAWEKALFQNDFWFDSPVQIGYIFAMQEKYREAIEQYDAFSTFKMIPEYAVVQYWNKARLYVQIGRYDDAQNLLLKGISAAESENMDDRKSQALELLAFVHAEKGNYAEAEKKLKACLEIRLRIALEQSFRWRAAYKCLSAFFDIRDGNLEGAKPLSYLLC